MSDVYESLCRELENLRPRRDKIEVPKEAIGEPLPGWRRSIGWPNRDTTRQYRDGVFHIHETSKETYRIHRDVVDPHVSPVKHLFVDMPFLVAAVLMLLTLFIAGAAVAF